MLFHSFPPPDRWLSNGTPHVCSCQTPAPLKRLPGSLARVTQTWRPAVHFAAHAPSDSAKKQVAPSSDVRCSSRRNECDSTTSRTEPNAFFLSALRYKQRIFSLPPSNGPPISCLNLSREILTFAACWFAITQQYSGGGGGGGGGSTRVECMKCSFLISVLNSWIFSKRQKGTQFNTKPDF